MIKDKWVEVKDRARNFEELLTLVDTEDYPTLERVFQWLQWIKPLIEELNSNADITSVVAFGKVFDPAYDRRKAERAWRGEHFLEVLVVTPNEDTFDLLLSLADHVFGPVIGEFGYLPKLHLWSKSRLDIERNYKSHLWKTIKRQGILLTGEPLWE